MDLNIDMSYIILFKMENESHLQQVEVQQQSSYSIAECYCVIDFDDEIV